MRSLDDPVIQINIVWLLSKSLRFVYLPVFPAYTHQLPELTVHSLPNIVHFLMGATVMADWCRYLFENNTMGVLPNPFKLNGNAQF